jgi:hypothetical protein
MRELKLQNRWMDGKKKKEKDEKDTKTVKKLWQNPEQ